MYKYIYVYLVLDQKKALIRPRRHFRLHSLRSALNEPPKKNLIFSPWSKLLPYFPRTWVMLPSMCLDWKSQLKIHSKLVEVSVLKVFFLKIFSKIFFWAKKLENNIKTSVGFFLQINVFSVVNVCLSVLDGGRRRRSGGVKSEKLRIRELSGASKKTTPHRCHKSGAQHPAG